MRGMFIDTQIEMVMCLKSTMSDFGYYEKFTRLNAVYNQRKDATYRSERRCIMRKLFRLCHDYDQFLSCIIEKAICII